MDRNQGLSRVSSENVRSISDLLTLQFDIPPFQRPYDWEPRQVNDLINDLHDSITTGQSLFLGLVVLHNGGSSINIIDGQQRLTTIMLAIAAKEQTNKIYKNSEQGLKKLWIEPREEDSEFLKSLLAGRLASPKTYSQWLMTAAYNRLRETPRIPVESIFEAELIPYYSPNIAGATRLFERINLRGKKVSEFDLVKNRLIDSTSKIADKKLQEEVQDLIVRQYDCLYRLINPVSRNAPFNCDKLLKLHWILFSRSQFKSGQRVLDCIKLWLTENSESSKKLANAIEKYLNTLVEITETWVWVERPFEASPPRNVSSGVKNALLDFAKLNRDAELQPLIVASIVRLNNEAEDVIRFCEIHSFRCALGQKNSNYGRSYKWRVARDLYQRKLVDHQGSPIQTSESLVHQLFWEVTPFWSRAEATALGYDYEEDEFKAEIVPKEAIRDNSFTKKYGLRIHYLFWKYGKHLLECEKWGDALRFDISPFQESVWFSKDESTFLDWDIEHIYPRNPDDLENRKGRQFQRTMTKWLDHLGNITVLPKSDNRSMQNAPFVKKLSWMREQKKVPFNELLANRSYRGNLQDRPHWGPHNCEKRLDDIVAFADEAWGTDAIVALGVGTLDERISDYSYEEEGAEEGDHEDE